MKRFLSIMLTVMLVLSSFVMVSADDSFSVIIIDGKTVNYPFGVTYDGYYEISADVYVVQGATATIIAKNGEDEVETVAADAEKAPSLCLSPLRLPLHVAAKTHFHHSHTADHRGGLLFLPPCVMGRL